MQTVDFNIFLNVFTRVVTSRYPDNLTSIPKEELENVAQDCITVSEVALRTWTDFSSGRERRIQRPTQRAA